jgi:hypothetical protein
MSDPSPTTYVLDAYDAYITCALWSSTCEDADDDFVAMDSHYEADDVAVESRLHMLRDVADFVADNLDDIAETPEYQEGSYVESASTVGHDLWLTRNGHGTGFWDRGLGELGTRLTCAAHAMGASELYVGDDGRVHVT